MNGFSRPVLIVVLFLTVFIPICFAGTDDILSGRDLLMAVRERDGRSPKPAYANRPAKPVRPLLRNGQRSQVAVKSVADKLPETALTDYTKDTKYPRTRPLLVPESRGKLTDIKAQRPSEETTTFRPLRYEMPFEQAIEILRNSVKPPLNIVVRWRDLEENAGIDRITPVNMDIISGVQLGTALRLLLNSASADVKLDYIIQDGVIVIATRQSLPRRFETRVYNVSGLLGQPANYRGRLGSARDRSTLGGGFQAYGR